jgi:hypothetical protein
MKLMEARQMSSDDTDTNAWRVNYGSLIRDLMRLPETYSAMADLLGQAPPPEAVGAVDEEEDMAEEEGHNGDMRHDLRAILPPRLVHSLRATAHRADHHLSSYDGSGGAVYKRTATEGSNEAAEDDGELLESSALHSNERFYSEYDKNIYGDINDDAEGD